MNERTLSWPTPARLAIDYPDRALDRLSTLLRLIYVIPIAIVLGLVGHGFESESSIGALGAAGGGVLVAPVLLMILFRRKYPRWWFDFNLELARFSTRVISYLALMSDTYPSTDEEQSVHLDIDYPDVEQDLKPLAAVGEMAARHSPLHRPRIP